jgi:predicted naringenin-chalcone synthase
MGCAAGISGIIYAKNFQSNPGKRAAVIAVESPTATFQLNDFSMSNIVMRLSLATALFVFSSQEDDEGPEILRKKCIIL